jgi:hypothetical protein
MSFSQKLCLPTPPAISVSQMYGRKDDEGRSPDAFRKSERGAPNHNAG